jgi:hypothetical protein
MKERPILFSAPMVRAILDGTKTQTRRAVRKQFADDALVAEVAATTSEGWQTSGHSGMWWDDAGACLDDAVRCPYGMPGDRLWVRETWAVPHRFDHLGPSNIPPKGVPTHYAATEDRGGLRWRPSIHMCRWASRITLEITDVRVERLQDISAADAKAEGIEGQFDDGPWRNYCRDGYWFPEGKDTAPVFSYQSLWESINGPVSWDANPWVWVVEFKRV